MGKISLEIWLYQSTNFPISSKITVVTNRLSLLIVILLFYIRLSSKYNYVYYIYKKSTKDREMA